jgi:peptidoglycan/xylan/chitin deacetylase (PgdA/CDA1 family)
MKSRVLHAVVPRTPILLAVVVVFVAAATAALFFSRPPSASASVQTIVTIQFDDGNVDQYQALALLNAHGMHATFYVNTGVVGDSAHLSWSQLQSLFAAGNDIGGHTLTHANLKHLKTADARLQVCQDRDNLIANGKQPTAFAYPFGSFDSGTEQIAQACGYNSGRGVSGVDDRRTFAETVPPADAYATRTPPNPKQGTTVATIEGYVTAAEQHSGGGCSSSSTTSATTAMPIPSPPPISKHCSIGCSQGQQAEPLSRPPIR